MRGQTWFLGILVFCILIVFYANPLFGQKVRHLLVPGAPLEYSGSDLTTENLILKTKLAELEGSATASSAFRSTSNVIVAPVYSRYPFNIKNEILIAVGRSEGVIEGDAVVLSAGTSSPGIFLGRVLSVFSDSSLVQTIFDERWQSAVKVGSGGTEALLKGGFSPRLTLIAKDAKIASGDVIISVDSAFPYGLPIAEVDTVSVSKDQVFQEASIRLSYDVSRFGYVAVLHAKQ